MSKKTRVIYWTSFGGVDKVTLCLSNKSYNKACNKLGYDYVIGDRNDGICTLFTKKGERGECVIGIKDTSLQPELLLPLITHEIVHAVDFIMEEDSIKDMEFRSYAVQDMLAKTMLYLKDIGVLSCKGNNE